jgi:hypothetical protein
MIYTYITFTSHILITNFFDFTRKTVTRNNIFKAIYKADPIKIDDDNFKSKIT